MLSVAPGGHNSLWSPLKHGNRSFQCEEVLKGKICISNCGVLEPRDKTNFTLPTAYYPVLAPDETFS